MPNRVRSIAGVILSCLLLTLAVSLAPTTSAADETPLSQDQLIQMSTGTLKSHPEEVRRYIDRRGVSFFPTKSKLHELEAAHVDASIINAIRMRIGAQMRIKVCQFEGFEAHDLPIATDLRNAMVRSLIDAKMNRIEPFGFIPLDQDPGLETGCAGKIKPESSALHYIVLQGWVRKTSSGFSLRTQVIYRDPSGIQHPLAGAENPPQDFTKENLEDTARKEIDWALETARKFAET